MVCVCICPEVMYCTPTVGLRASREYLAYLKVGGCVNKGSDGRELPHDLDRYTQYLVSRIKQKSMPGTKSGSQESEKVRGIWANSVKTSRVQPK